MVAMEASGNPPDWWRWLSSWDRQQEHLLPDREQRLAAIFDVIEAALGAPHRVLDVAGGPGSITVRLLRRFPQVEVTLIDVDPALLAIARGVVADDRRVQIVGADLARADWVERLPVTEYDAAVTMNSLHWLEEPVLRRVYADLARLVRLGGVVCNADPMPPTGVDGLIAAMDRQAERLRPKVPEGEVDWTGWWAAAAADPALAPLVVERNQRFGGETHPPDFTPPLAWHVAALRAPGFAEAGCVWRHGSAGLVAAVR
jgi:SAM-dependent methyltransferase